MRAHPGDASGRVRDAGTLTGRVFIDPIEHAFMRRRPLLAALGATVATAGCVTGYAADDTGDDPTGESPTTDGDDGQREGEGEGIDAPTLAEQGRPPTLCEEDLRPEGIRAVDDPSFCAPEAWPDDPDGYRPLEEGSTVIGVERDGAARAYPLTVLNVHEIVNDTLGEPMIVTYCPICRSGMVADRRVDGDTATFDVSGLLWVPPRIYTAAAEEEGRVFSDREDGVGNNGNLVMYDDATGSYWSQMLGQAICGPRAETRLRTLPSTVSTLGAWREDNPDGGVLLPPPASGIVDPPI